MLQLLFWNLHRNSNLVRPLTELAKSRRTDIVILAETPAEAEISTALTAVCGGGFRHHGGRVNSRIQIYARQEIEIGEPVGESHYLVVHPVSIGTKPIFFLAAMHGISRLESDLSELNEEACVAADLLRAVEARAKHRRTILIGDFNLNPFDEGMFKVRGFFGVMSRQDASRQTQRLKWEKYPLFYNPMWSRLGDLSPGPAGTYYRAPTTHYGHYWHTYDQVLVRPSLAGCFDAESFEVVTQIGSRELLRDGVPDVDSYSDHLPLVVGFDLDRMIGAL
jgi:hypothetical protein